MFERAPQFRLEHDWQRDENQRDGLLQQPRDDMELHPVADERDAEEHQQAFDERDGARVLEHLIDFVKDDGDNQDVEDVQGADRRKDAAQLRRHLRHELKIVA